MSTAKIVVAGENRVSPVFSRIRNDIKGLGREADGLRNTVGLLAPALAGVFSAAGLVAFVKGANDSLLKIKDLSEATGSAVNKVSGLDEVARNAGSTLDEAGAILLKFNQALRGADENSEIAQALKRIGLNAEDLRRADPADALQTTARALEGFADNGERARLVATLFGRSVEQAAPFLRDLAEAGELNGRVTREQAEEADKLNKQIARLRATAEDGARALNSVLVPALNEYLDLVRRVSREPITFGKELSSEVAGLRLRLAVGRVEDLQAALDKSPGNTAISDALQRARKDAEDLLKAANNANAALKETLGVPAQLGRRPANEGGGGLRSRTLLPAAPPGAAAKQKEAQTEADRYLQTLLRQAEGVAELTTAERVLLDIRAGRAGQVGVVQQEVLRGIAAEIDATREAIRVARERADFRNADYQAAEDAARANDEATRERLRNILGNTVTGQLQATGNTLDFLAEQFLNLNIDTKEWGEAIDSVLPQLETLRGSAEDTSSLAKELGLTFSSAFEDAILNGEKFSNVLKALRRDLLRILIRKSITEPLANAAGDLLSGVLGSANGNAFGPGGVIPFRAGGVVQRPTIFGFGRGRVGSMAEEAPEAIMPLKRGRNGKLGVQAEGGGSTINLAVNVAGDASENTVALIESALSQFAARMQRDAA